MHVLVLQILMYILTNACTGSTDTYKYMDQCIYWFYRYLCIYGPVHVLVLQMLMYIWTNACTGSIDTYVYMDQYIY